MSLRSMLAAALTGAALAVSAASGGMAMGDGTGLLAAGADSVRLLQEVTVAARRSVRTMATSQTLQGEELRALSSTSVADALKYFAGVQIKDYGGLGG